MPQGNEFAFMCEIRKVKSGDPACGVDGRLKSPFEAGNQFLQGISAGGAVEAADGHIDGMDGSATEDFQQGVSVFFQSESAGDFGGEFAGEFHSAGDSKKIRGLQQMHMQGVAFDPFAAVEEPAELADFRSDGDAQDFFEGVDCGHLIGDRADSADTGGDVGNFFEGTSAQKAFKETRWFVDCELDIFDGVAVEPNDQSTFPLNSRQSLNADGSGIAHGIGILK